MFSPDFIIITTLLSTLILIPWLIVVVVFIFYTWYSYCGIELCLGPSFFDALLAIMVGQLNLPIV